MLAEDRVKLRADYDLTTELRALAAARIDAAPERIQLYSQAFIAVRAPMPSAETLQRFIALVEQNAHAEAVEKFYTADASMQENQSTPRVGRDAHVANERAVLSRAKSVVSKSVQPVFVNGDRVVIRWIFRFEWLDGTVTHMEELAYQRWEGERIAEETFFYDPAQRVPKKLL